MKAWFVADGECGAIVWAETRGVARERGVSEICGEDFLSVSIVRRAPFSDGEPRASWLDYEFFMAGGTVECRRCGQEMWHVDNNYRFDWPGMVAHNYCPLWWE